MSRHPSVGADLRRDAEATRETCLTSSAGIATHIPRKAFCYHPGSSPHPPHGRIAAISGSHGCDPEASSLCDRGRDFSVAQHERLYGQCAAASPPSSSNRGMTERPDRVFGFSRLRAQRRLQIARRSCPNKNCSNRIESLQRIVLIGGDDAIRTRDLSLAKPTPCA